MYTACRRRLLHSLHSASSGQVTAAVGANKLGHRAVTPENTLGTRYTSGVSTNKTNNTGRASEPQRVRQWIGLLDVQKPELNFKFK